MRKLIYLLLATVLLGSATMEGRNNTAPADPFGKAPAEQTTKLKQKLIEVPPGTWQK